MRGNSGRSRSRQQKITLKMKEINMSGNLSLVVVNHHVVWLDVSVDYAVCMAEVKRFKKLKHVEAHVKVSQRRIQHLDQFKEEER